MADLAAITEGVALFKSGMEGIRGALGIWRDIRGSIPEGSQRDEVSRALEQSERQLQFAEAQIAKGLGCTLCECAFPPTPMLTVGWINGGGKANPSRAVRRCPRCGLADHGGWAWTPTAAISEYTDKVLARTAHMLQTN
jgi:hypothetical protein